MNRGFFLFWSDIMDFKAMNRFLSEENIKRHLEHLRTQKLRLSILEKSIPELGGKTMAQICRSNLKSAVKDEALDLMWYIRSHECFFDSFCENQQRNMLILKHFSSLEKYIYDIYTEAKGYNHGFLYMFIDKLGIPRTHYSDRYDGAFVKYKPCLAIDLYEHTYFSDYGFDRERFLKNALTHLDVSKLS